MWKKTPLKPFFYASLGINLVLALFIFVMKSFLPPVVPLYYGLPSGESQLAPSMMLLLIPAGSLVITLLNLFITSLLKDEFYKKSLIVSGTLISFLGALTVVKIIFLVGFF